MNFTEQELHDAEKWVLYEKKGPIAIITWNRPEKRNCMTPAMVERMIACFDDFNKDSNLLVAIFAGAGDKAWCGGADLDAMIPVITAGQWKSIEQKDPTKHLCQDIFKPIIGAINGFANAELVLACDLVVASEKAVFSLAEVRWGMVPAGGSHVRLPRAIPRAVAMQMLLTGMPISAQRAYQVGLCNDVVPLDQLMPKAMEYAEQICKCGPLAVQSAKEIVVRQREDETANVLEHLIVQRVINSDDAKEGPRSFMERRPAVFTGK